MDLQVLLGGLKILRVKSTSAKDKLKPAGWSVSPRLVSSKITQV